MRTAESFFVLLALVPYTASLVITSTPVSGKGYHSSSSPRGSTSLGSSSRHGVTRSMAGLMRKRGRVGSSAAGGFDTLSRSNSRSISNDEGSASVCRSVAPLSALPLTGLGALTTTIGSNASALLAVTFVIFFHECGHFFAARLQGIKVEGFSVGFGPAIFERGPGAGDDAAAALAAAEEAKAKEEEARKVEAKRRGWAGALFASISQSRATKEEVPAPAATTALATATTAAGGQRLGSRIAALGEGVTYSLRAIPLGGYVSFPPNFLPTGENGEPGEELTDPDLLQNRSIAQRAAVIGAGVVANVVLAFLLFSWTIQTNGLTKPEFQPGVKLTHIMDRSGGAAMAGLQEGDVFLSVDGVKLEKGFDSLEYAVTSIRGSNGSPVKVDVLRAGTKSTKVVKLKKLESNPSYYSMGVQLSANVDGVKRVIPSSPVETVQLAAAETSTVIRDTTKGLSQLLRGSGGLGQVQGPVGVVKTGGEMARDGGARSLLPFAAVISINLAVVNALPFPGLDGGQMAFLLLELVQGKKLDREVAATINGVAFLLLLALGISATVGDIMLQK